MRRTHQAIDVSFCNHSQLNMFYDDIVLLKGGKECEKKNHKF